MAKKKASRRRFPKRKKAKASASASSSSSTNPIIKSGHRKWYESESRRRPAVTETNPHFRSTERDMAIAARCGRTVELHASRRDWVGAHAAVDRAKKEHAEGKELSPGGDAPIASVIDSQRILNILLRDDINTVAELTVKSREYLLAIANIGGKVVQEIYDGICINSVIPELQREAISKQWQVKPFNPNEHQDPYDNLT